MNRIFIDTDIILDLFTQRDPFYIHSAVLFNIINTGKLKGFVSALIFSNLYYILRKQKSKIHALNILKKLKLLVTVLPVDNKIIELALSSDFNDFEDAIQYYTAKSHNINYIVTRNLKDYKSTEINAFTAEQFLNLLKNPT